MIIIYGDLMLGMTGIDIEKRTGSQSILVSRGKVMKGIKKGKLCIFRGFYGMKFSRNG